MREEENGCRSLLIPGLKPFQGREEGWRTMMARQRKFDRRLTGTQIEINLLAALYIRILSSRVRTRVVDKLTRRDVQRCWLPFPCELRNRTSLVLSSLVQAVSRRSPSYCTLCWTPSSCLSTNAVRQIWHESCRSGAACLTTSTRRTTINAFCLSSQAPSQDLKCHPCAVFRDSSGTFFTF